jgi:hypothetical protein
MTEQQWLTSSDPAAMWAVVEATATERQCKHFVEALLPDTSNGRRTWKQFAGEICFYGVPVSAGDRNGHRADLLREIFGNPFRGTPLYYPSSVPKTHEQPSFYRANRYLVVMDEWLRWHDGAIPRMAQAIYGESCLTCNETGTLLDGTEMCTACSGNWRDPFNPAAMPLLADLLEEAGCTDETILTHLRGKEQCPCQSYECREQYACKVCQNIPDEAGTLCHGKGCYVLDSDGGGEGFVEIAECRCNGTGWRPITHMRGCWVLETILNK